MIRVRETTLGLASRLISSVRKPCPRVPPGWRCVSWPFRALRRASASLRARTRPRHPAESLRSRRPIAARGRSLDRPDAIAHDHAHRVGRNEHSHQPQHLRYQTVQGQEPQDRCEDNQQRHKREQEIECQPCGDGESTRAPQLLVDNDSDVTCLSTRAFDLVLQLLCLDHMRNPFVPMNIFAAVDVSGTCHLSRWQCNIQALFHSF